MSIRPRRWSAMRVCFRAAVAAWPDPLDRFRGQGQSQCRGARHARRARGSAPTSSRAANMRRARAAGIAAGEDRLLGRRQDRAGDGRGAGGRALPVQPRIGRGGGDAVRRRDLARHHRAGRLPRQSGRRGRHPRQDLDRRRRQQVRHPDRHRARRLCPRPRAARPRVQGVAVHIGSQLTDLAPLEAAFSSSAR